MTQGWTNHALGELGLLRAEADRWRQQVVDADGRTLAAETERAEKAEADRDQARQIARALRTCYLTGDAAGLATTPDWLTEEMT